MKENKEHLEEVCEEYLVKLSDMKAKVTVDKYCSQLFTKTTLNNSWTGITITPKLARLCVHVLNKYIANTEGE